jgi:hypothetical protein
VKVKAYLRGRAGVPSGGSMFEYRVGPVPFQWVATGGGRYSVGISKMSGGVVFRGEDYRPSPFHADPSTDGTLRAWASDAVGFAMAYVERPEEFDRTPQDVEQATREWWLLNGESLSLDLE